MGRAVAESAQCNKLAFYASHKAGWLDKLASKPYCNRDALARSSPVPPKKEVKLVPMTIRIPEDIKEELGILSIRSKRSIQEIATEALEKVIDKALGPGWRK
jgi:hypothetical protein